MCLTSYNSVSSDSNSRIHIPLVSRSNGQGKREIVSGHLSELFLLPSLYRGCLLNSGVNDLWEKRTPSSYFAIAVFPSKPGLSLLVPKTDLVLMFALAGPGAPPTPTPCQASPALPIHPETCCSPLSFPIGLASVYLNSFYELMTVGVDFDMAPLQDEAS